MGGRNSGRRKKAKPDAGAAPQGPWTPAELTLTLASTAPEAFLAAAGGWLDSHHVRLHPAPLGLGLGGGAASPHAHTDRAATPPPCLLLTLLQPARPSSARATPLD
jgi:hypothetical protein